MKKALICLEQLGIGGVETFTITQVEEFTRRNIKCYVLAREGMLSKHLKKLKNVELIEFDFQLKNEIDTEKVKWLIKFTKEKKIDFIYVHQFPCIPYILPVVFKTKTPYVAYLHTVVPKTCEWYMDHYDIYQVLFPLYFEYASKIIAITEKVKKENLNLFHLPDEKYKVIKNSLDFNKYPNKKIINIKYPYNNLMWFGRISKEKAVSIDTAVKFFKHYKDKYNNKATLTIVGDGEMFDETVKKYQDSSIVFKGAVADMNPEIEKADILLGVDRCILEAVASKKPSIICSYNGRASLITPKNIELAIEENFTGINLEDNKDELFNYKENELIEIINKNYDFVSQHFSISNSVYLDIKPFKSMSTLESVFKGLNYYSKKERELEQENKKLFLETQSIYKERDELQKALDNTIDRRIKNKLRRMRVK